MPHKCINCDKIARVPLTDCCEQPLYARIETIHFASPSGVGRVVSGGVRVQGNNKDLVENRLPLKLGCYSEVEDAKFTVLPIGVTCLHCLEFISQQAKE